MEMEGKEVEPKSKTAPPMAPVAVAEGGSPSSLASGSGTSAKGEGDEGHQMKFSGQEGDDDGDGVDVAVEASDGEEGEEADPPSNDEEDDDGWSTVRVDDPMEYQDLDSQSDEEEDDDEDDMSSVESWDDDIDSSSEEEDDEDDAQVDDEDDDGNTNISDGEASSGGSPKAHSEALFGVMAGEQHPMKNPVILKNMFELCPPQLLKNFRLVCKQWLDLSLEAWRSSATLVFQQDSEGTMIQFQAYGVTDFEGVPLKKFLNYVNKPKNQCLKKPFRRYHLAEVEFPVEERDDVRGRKLWELVKRDATSLKVWHCSFPNMEVFRELIYKDLPNLKELELYQCHTRLRKEPISVGEYPEHNNLKSLSITIDLVGNRLKFPIPIDWLEVCSQFPWLTRLSVGSDEPLVPADKPFDTSELLRLLAAIQTVRKADPRKLPLKDFDILPYFPTSPHRRQFGEVFLLLQELHLPLQSLKLFMDSSQERKVKKFASQIDGSRLRSLNCYRDGISTFKFPFKMPLENLSKLLMEDVIWENMDFLRLVPNLTELEITDYESPDLIQSRHRSVSVAMLSKTCMEGLADVRLLKMNKFTWGYALTEDDLRHFGNLFPNLTKLSTTLDDKLFPIVCEQWRDLKLLYVDGAELTDEGVTGLKAGQIVEDLDTMELPPNIRRLQKLKLFKCPKSLKITDVSVFNGFLTLPQLVSLTLGRGPSQKAKAAVTETGEIKMYLKLDIN